MDWLITYFVCLFSCLVYVYLFPALIPPFSTSGLPALNPTLVLPSVLVVAPFLFLPLSPLFCLPLQDILLSHPHMCEGWAAPSVHLVEGWPPAEDGWPLSHPVHRVSGRRYGYSADPQNTGRKQIIGIFHIRCERTYHRRRIKTEEKEQVVASVWGQEFTQFLAALAVLLRTIFNNWMNCTRMNSLYS